MEETFCLYQNLRLLFFLGGVAMIQIYTPFKDTVILLMSAEKIISA